MVFSIRSMWYSGKNMVVGTRCPGFNPYLYDPWNIQSCIHIYIPICMHFLILNNVMNEETETGPNELHEITKQRSDWIWILLQFKACIFSHSTEKEGSHCKTCEGSEILPFLSFTHASRRRKTPRSEAKGLHSITSSMSFRFQFSSNPQTP